LKTLVDLNYDGTFKLSQRENNGIVVKYLMITGSQTDNSETFCYNIEIETHFDQSKYPQPLHEKDISFDINTVINEHYF